MKRLHVLCASTGSPQSLGAQARGTHPQLASAIRTIGSGSAIRGIMADRPAMSGGFAVLGMAGIDQNRNDESATPIPPYDFPQAARRGSAWKKGLVIGAVAGVALGILVHAAIDSLPIAAVAGAHRKRPSKPREPSSLPWIPKIPRKCPERPL